MSPMCDVCASAGPPLPPGPAAEKAGEKAGRGGGSNRFSGCCQKKIEHGSRAASRHWMGAGAPALPETNLRKHVKNLHVGLSVVGPCAA